VEEPGVKQVDQLVEGSVGLEAFWVLRKGLTSVPGSTGELAKEQERSLLQLAIHLEACLEEEGALSELAIVRDGVVKHRDLERSRGGSRHGDNEEARRAGEFTKRSGSLWMGFATNVNGREYVAREVYARVTKGSVECR